MASAMRERNDDARRLYELLAENRSGRAKLLREALANALATERRLMAQRIKPRIIREARYYHAASTMRGQIADEDRVVRIIDEEAEG
jgi:hypothetical protein